jgi:hypothetical protein
MFGLLRLTGRDKRRNVDIMGNSTVEENRNYQQNWFKHINRTQNDRLPKVALLYKPMEKETWAAEEVDGRKKII